MVGSSLKVKGGMTTVVESFLQHKFEEGITLKYIPTHIETKNNLYKKLFFLRGLVQIINELTFGKVEIIHMHMSERGSFSRKYIIFKLSKLFNKKVITHTHGAEFEEFYNQSDEQLKGKINKLLKESDTVITLGESWNNIIKRIENESNTFILRNSVPIPVQQNELNDKKIKILFLAVLIKRKGILDLIEASKKIIKELEAKNKQVEFIIAGDGELESSSKSLAEKLGVSKYFRFVGWVNNEQKQELLKESDVFVLPSYNEGLPLSILEAISYGIPVISTNVGSINEAVKNEKNGYLINPGDKEKLADFTIKLITECNFKHMGQASRKVAVDLFDINSYFKMVENLYLTLDQRKTLGSSHGTK
ncbi:hypothetical protein ABD94_25035 [Bacillus aryabhattai]|nr:hypothetical protein [Priestia aryabhattai]